MGDFHNFFYSWILNFRFPEWDNSLLLLPSDQTGTLPHSVSYSKDTCVLFTSMKVGKMGKNGGIPPLPITSSWRVAVKKITF
jgi:hypothetical protein